MKTLKRIGSAVAVGVLLTACGADNGGDARKVTTGNPVLNGADRNTTAIATRNMQLDPELIEMFRRSERSFDPAMNCFELVAETSVNVYSGGCGQAVGTEKPGAQGQKPTKTLLFTLAVEPVKLEVGQKPSTPVKPGKPEQVGAPASKLYYLVLKGKQGKEGKQGQSIPDTRVGAFVIEHLPMVEPVGNQQSPPKQEIVGGKKQESVAGKQQEPVGKQEQLGQKPQPQNPPKQEPIGKKAVKYAEHVTVLELCTNAFEKSCSLVFEGSRLNGIRLAHHELTAGPQKGKEQVGQQQPPK